MPRAYDERRRRDHPSRCRSGRSYPIAGVPCAKCPNGPRRRARRSGLRIALLVALILLGVVAYGSASTDLAMRSWFHIWARAAILVTLPCNGVLEAQEPTPAVSSKVAPCLEPPPLLKWEDYQGPLRKIVGTFARKLERKAAQPPRYKPGTALCSLEVKDKFALFIQDTFDPVSFLGAGFYAGLDHAANNDPTFGQGAGGYGRRFGVQFAGQTASRFFTEFAYPTIFSEDPRYYRLGHGTGGKRFLHAAEHAFVARRDSGTRMFHFSKWLGAASAVALNNTYHPGSRHGFGPTMRQVGYSVLEDMGIDLLREFWPEIARKLRMPFRGIREPPETERRR
jgi:hypothetical protein